METFTCSVGWLAGVDNRLQNLVATFMHYWEAGMPPEQTGAFGIPPMEHLEDEERMVLQE